MIPDWGTVLPKADIAKGQAITGKCASCHQFDPGDTPNIGPGLYGVVGRQPGSQAKYTTYDSAMHDFEAAGHTAWTYDLLYEFLKGPQQFMPGTKMTFVGLKDPQDRINVIAYLRSNGSPTYPIPAPRPGQAGRARRWSGDQRDGARGELDCAGDEGRPLSSDQLFKFGHGRPLCRPSMNATRAVGRARHGHPLACVLGSPGLTPGYDRHGGGWRGTPAWPETCLTAG